MTSMLHAKYTQEQVGKRNRNAGKKRWQNKTCTILPESTRALRMPEQNLLTGA